MVIDLESRTHIYYETIAQTSKELQNEVLSVLNVVCDLFFDKQKVLITLNRNRELSGTIGEIYPEIVTLVVEIKDFDEFRKRQIDKSQFWGRLKFFRRALKDRYFNAKIPIQWKLIP